MHDVQAFLSHYRRQRRWTVALFEAVPEERFDWAPQPDAFTCGGLARHLMQSEVFWRKLVTKGAAGEAYDPFGIPGDPDKRLASFRPRNLAGSGDDRWGGSFAECIGRWREIQADTEKELATFTPEQLREVTVHHPLTGLSAPLWELLFVMVEHEAHHRGQLSAYLKMLGLPQPPVVGT